MKFISNLKPSWAGILAIAVACSVISYHNNKLAEETKKDQYIHQINIPTFEEVFEPAVKSFDELETQLNEVIIPEGLHLDQIESEEAEEMTEEAGFSK